MAKESIQAGRDRIGYTKRTRRNKNGTHPPSAKIRALSKSVTPDNRFPYFDFLINRCCFSADEEEALSNIPGTSHKVIGVELVHHSNNPQAIVNIDPMLERLTLLENNFSLLLSRADIQTYATLDEALAAPSIFAKPITVSMNDPIAAPNSDKNQRKMPFWRSRIITLYIDWAKTFSAFRKLPHADKVLIGFDRSVNSSPL
jgi:hypothetical protein